MVGSILKAEGLSLTPVETCLPVLGHIVVTMPITNSVATVTRPQP